MESGDRERAIEEKKSFGKILGRKKVTALRKAYVEKIMKRKKESSEEGRGSRGK